jgi:hypothetical protein
LLPLILIQHVVYAQDAGDVDEAVKCVINDSGPTAPDDVDAERQQLRAWIGKLQQEEQARKAAEEQVRLQQLAADQHQYMLHIQAQQQQAQLLAQQQAQLLAQQQQAQAQAQLQQLLAQQQQPQQPLTAQLSVPVAVAATATKTVATPMAPEPAPASAGAAAAAAGAGAWTPPSAGKCLYCRNKDVFQGFPYCGKRCAAAAKDDGWEGDRPPAGWIDKSQQGMYLVKTSSKFAGNDLIVVTGDREKQLKEQFLEKWEHPPSATKGKPTAKDIRHVFEVRQYSCWAKPFADYQKMLVARGDVRKFGKHAGVHRSALPACLPACLPCVQSLPSCQLHTAVLWCGADTDVLRCGGVQCLIISLATR